MGKRIADRVIPTIQVISQGVIIIATGMILTVIGAGIYESLRTPALNRLSSFEVRLFPPALSSFRDLGLPSLSSSRSQRKQCKTTRKPVPLQSHREPKGQEGSPLAPRLSRYQAQPFASRDIAAGWNAHSNDTTTAKGGISTEL
jgi:hypothetical protein